MGRHAPGFLRLVDAALARIQTIEADALAEHLARHPDAALIDVREADEFAAGHVRGAEHLGKGVIERDIAQRKAARTLEIHLARYGTLTPRERQVLREVAGGRLNKQIAFDLGISEITVKLHRGNVMRKMEARSLPELVRMADLLDQPG